MPREVASRLLTHLDGLRLEPRWILDLGCGPVGHAVPLRQRFRRARVLALDYAEPMAASARRAAPRWFSRQHHACADARALPLASRSIDFVFCSSMLHALQTPDPALAEIRRVLVPGGLLMFATYGPDTLRELRESWREVDDTPHVDTFIDMHDLGDALVRGGFSGVVMDTERLTIEYPDADALIADLSATGERNTASGRRATLTGRGRLSAMRAQLDRHRRDAVLPITYEVVYGHGWSLDAARGSIPVASPGPLPERSKERG